MGTNKRKVYASVVSVIVISLVIIFSVSCTGGLPFTGTGDGKEGQDIEFFKVKRGDIFQIVSTTGSVDSDMQNTYTLQGSGEIISALEKGDIFSKGDILVEPEDSDGLFELTQVEKDIELSESSLRAAQVSYQKALDENHIAVQLSEINIMKAEESAESALKSLEAANESASLSYESSSDALENVENTASWSITKAKSALDEAERILATDPGNEVYQYNVKAAEENYELIKAQQQASISGSEYSVETAEVQNKSSVISAQNSYEQSLLDQSYTYWNNLSSTQNAESQIETTRENIRQAEIQLDLVKMNLESAKENLLTDYKLIAPYDGVILSSDFRVGDQNSGTSTISVISNEFLIKATIGETDIPKISIGEESYISLDAYPDKEFSGMVEKVIPVSAEEGNIVSFEILINFTDNEEIEVFYGLSANVDIITEKADNVLFVPIQSVYKENDRSYVDLLVSEKSETEYAEESIEKVEVNTGINDYYYIEIISGLREGDVIITSRI
jgi:HlyD family secretion protein